MKKFIDVLRKIRERVFHNGIGISVALVTNFCHGSLHTKAEIEEMMRTFDWKHVESSILPKSNSTLSPPESYVYVVGEDARKMHEISGNKPTEELEAIAIDDNGDSTYFSYSDSGFISIEDWKELDPAALLTQIQDSTENGNQWRKSNGYSELHVLGWAQEPTLDTNTNTVFWAIAAEDDGRVIINSRAIRLGRYGFEKVTWVTGKDKYTPFGGCLDEMLRAHSFNKGARYQDHVSGDKVAGYGIAAVVAGMAGAKFVKVGGLAVVLKKVGSFLFAGICALFLVLKKRVKAWIGRRNGVVALTPPESA
jgi:uncharacterized membrane-anchored protein